MTQDERTAMSRLREASETAGAERDRALDLLSSLEGALTKIGGFMPPEVQLALRDSRALLVEHGRREPEPRVIWVDRG